MSSYQSLLFIGAWLLFPKAHAAAQPGAVVYRYTGTTGTEVDYFTYTELTIRY